MTQPRTLLALLALATLAACAGPGARTSPPADTLAGTPYCLSETGTRIRSEHCTPGRSYSREELQRTGSFSAGDALTRLSPSFSRSGH